MQKGSRHSVSFELNGHFGVWLFEPQKSHGATTLCHRDGWKGRCTESEARDVQKISQSRWDRTKDGDKEGSARQTDTPGVSVSPSCSQWAVSDPPCLLYGYSPASDGISNSLINQELCYVTLPLPLTHRRENHHSFFFSPAAHRVYITVCIPYWTINTQHRARSQAVTEIWEIYPRRGSRSRENLRCCHRGAGEKPLNPFWFPTCRFRNVQSSLNNYQRHTLEQGTWPSVAAVVTHSQTCLHRDVPLSKHSDLFVFFFKTITNVLVGAKLRRQRWCPWKIRLQAFKVGAVGNQVSIQVTCQFQHVQ